MIRPTRKPRYRSWIPGPEVDLSYERDDWFQYTSERAARAAAWRRKMRDKRRQRRDHKRDH